MNADNLGLRSILQRVNRRYILFFIDLIVNSSIGLMLSNVSNFKTPLTIAMLSLSLLILFGCVMLSRVIIGAYRRVWRYASSAEYLVLVIADVIGGSAYVLIVKAILPICGLSLSSIPISLAFATVASGCLANLSMRFVYKYLYRSMRTSGDSDANGGERDVSIEKINAAIVGAGTKGSLLAKELQLNRMSQFKPYCFIDRDSQKVGGSISGLRVYSDIGIQEKLKKMPVEAIIIAMQTLTADKKQELYDTYRDTGCKIFIYDVPHIVGDEISGKALNKPVLRMFNIEDLLFREPIRINDKKTSDYFWNKVVMITGGGGSIGSELCRQIAKLSPKRLIIFDIYENNAYDIQQEMRLIYGASLDLRVEIASICEKDSLDQVMERYHPDIVIHAAAHKHVPLMEFNSAEAVKNNVFGTLNVVESAEKYGVKKFILISTDKAVNPTNVMGATKRVCEMIIQSRHNSRTEFSAVRFGNVLGSNGSVVPLFKRQIEYGGPVTITDKRITRYFMTIPEAAQLVLEAGVMAKNGELFVLNMGKSVRMLKLAEDMIRLSGYEPYKDIDIKEIGLREGEKLYEELLVKPDEMIKTENDLIYIEHDKGLPAEVVAEKLARLEEALEGGDCDSVKTALMEVVPTYHYPEDVNKQVV